MRGCGFIAGSTVAVITLLVCFDVISRNLGLRTLPWINEVTEYALPIATLAAAPWLMWRNQHVRLDLLGAVLSPTAQRRVDRIASLFALVVSGVLVWYSMRALLDSRAGANMVLKALVFPEWWLFIPLPIGFGLLALECARRVWRPTGLIESADQPSATGAPR